MINRPFWLSRISNAWLTRPIVWLSGVRRAGKTSIARTIPGTIFVNCDLVSSLRRLEDSEAFFDGLHENSTVILDEVHRPPDPSLVLKTAADAFPSLRILATGPSTIAATRKFRDSLTGRKWPVYLCPVLWDECLEEFGIRDLDHRLLRGGLPEQLLSGERTLDFYAEWMDSYYARDISELFSVRDRSGFLSLLRLLFRQSGGLADISKLASECGISRPTVKSYIEGMTIAHAVFQLRPFSGEGRREIVHRPKVYAFDTGFVAYSRGWDSIRDEDRGLLWEHLVLDTLRAAGLESGIAYWRDKSGREIDFTIRRSDRIVDAVECKVEPDRFDPESMKRFRSFYPEGKNFLICPHVQDAYQRNVAGLKIRVISTRHLLKHISLED
jgi:predicted AAA+ superfamily ATPase